MRTSTYEWACSYGLGGFRSGPKASDITCDYYTKTDSRTEPTIERVIITIDPVVLSCEMPLTVYLKTDWAELFLTSVIVT